MNHMIILDPLSIPSDSPVPVCMAFHGNDSSPQAHVEYWRPLTSLGWLVALPQSSRSGDEPNTYMWNTPGQAEWNFQEVQNHFADLEQKYHIDMGRIVLAGFSMGGGMAIELVLGGHIPASGFIVVAPYVPYKYVDPQSNYADFVHARGQRGYCIVGEEDSFAVEGASALASRLPAVGISCQVESHPGLEHDYPVHFEQSVRRAIEFVTAK